MSKSETVFSDPLLRLSSVCSLLSAPCSRLSPLVTLAVILNRCFSVDMMSHTLTLWFHMNGLRLRQELCWSSLLFLFCHDFSNHYYSLLFLPLFLLLSVILTVLFLFSFCACQALGLYCKYTCFKSIVRFYSLIINLCFSHLHVRTSSRLLLQILLHVYNSHHTGVCGHQSNDRLIKTPKSVMFIIY